MKLVDAFTATRVVLVSLVALVFLGGCEKKPNEQTIKYNEEQQAKEKKASLSELKNCFNARYLEAEDRTTAKAAVAIKLRGLCEDEFVHLRAVKFHYAPVPDITTPPPKMVDEELGLVEAFVERMRTRIDKMLQQYRSPSNPELPPGHPPINPHQFNDKDQARQQQGV